MSDWKKAVRDAIIRLTSRQGSPLFTRQDLLKFELDHVVEQVGSRGSTPQQTLSRELQELAEAGFIKFSDEKGSYQLIDHVASNQNLRSSIASYYIDGFRSLLGFDIGLDRGLNALVGPNGAGKTNFIDFLDFLSILIMRDASAAVSVSGGVSRVFSQENVKRASPRVLSRVAGIANLGPHFWQDDGRVNFRFEYDVSVRFSRAHSVIYISDEKIKLFALHAADEDKFKNRQVGSIHIKRRTPSPEIEPTIAISPRLLSSGIRNPLRYLRRAVTRNSPPRLIRSDGEYNILSAPAPDESLLGMRPIRPAMEAVREAISRGRAFNLNPSLAREPDELSRLPNISSDGSGLSASLYHMQQFKRGQASQYLYRFQKFGAETLDMIIQWTRLVLPELLDIQATADPHTGKYLAFLIVGDQERSLRIPLQAASDGTIKWLSFVAMLLSRGSSYSLEEPENYLHPKMQQFLVDLIRDGISENSPNDFFLISTHSETIINQLRPEELLVFEFNKGRTFCRKLENPMSVAEEINCTGFALGHFYATNAVS